MGAGGDVHTTLRFADGSVATISYVTDGSSRFPKETLDVVGDGRNGRLDNFQRVTVWSAKGKNGHRALTGQDKGQRSSWSASCRRFGPVPQCRSRWTPWLRRHVRRSLREAVCRQESRLAGESSQCRLVHPTTTQDVASRGVLPFPRRRASPGLGASSSPTRRAGRTAAGYSDGPGFHVAATSVGSHHCGSGCCGGLDPGCRRGPQRNLDCAGKPTARQRGSGLVLRSGDWASSA